MQSKSNTWKLMRWKNHWRSTLTDFHTNMLKRIMCRSETRHPEESQRFPDWDGLILTLPTGLFTSFPTPALYLIRCLRVSSSFTAPSGRSVGLFPSGASQPPLRTPGSWTLKFVCFLNFLKSLRSVRLVVTRSTITLHFKSSAVNIMSSEVLLSIMLSVVVGNVHRENCEAAMVKWSLMKLIGCVWVWMMMTTVTDDKL